MSDPDSTLRLPRRYLGWVAAAGISDVGVAALYVALGWAATAHGGAVAGLVVAVITAARTALLLIGGAVADRVGPRAVMLAGDSGLLIVTVLLAVLALILGTPVWLLLAAAVAEGVVSAFYQPAAGSLPRRLVPDRQVGQAVALRGGTGELAELAGGPLGGLLITTGGFAFAAAMDAATYLPVLLAVLLLRPRRPPEPAVPQSLVRDLTDGLSLAARDPVLRIALALVAVVAAVFVPVSAVLVPLLIRTRGLPATDAGLLIAALSAGSIAVALTISRTGTARHTGVTMSAGLGTAAIGLAIMATLTPVALLAPGAIVAGAGIGLFTGHLFPLLLATAPETHLSRIIATVSLVQAAALTAAAPLLGTLRPQTALALAAAGLAAASAATLLTPTWRTASSDDAADS